MKFLRPIVPPKGSELFCFGFASVVALAMLGYLIWAAYIELTTWTDAIILTLLIGIGMVPAILAGFGLRWHRRRREKQLQEYERILTSLKNV